MRYLYNCTLLCFGLLFFSVSYSQLISGKVINERGYNAPGITIKLKNNRNAVVSNADGRFKITATTLPDTLIFSAIGYEPYKVMVTPKTVKDPNFEIVLLANRQRLDEAIVVGYGTAKQKSLTGSTATVTDKLLKDTRSFASDELRERSPRTEGELLGKAFSSTVSIRGIGVVTGSPMYEMSSGGRTSRKVYLSDSAEVSKKITRASQLLTAGEVNDFKKWKMWEDYNAGEFKSLSQHWQLFPTHRYSLQLQNRDHTEIVGQQVYLINEETKDTVWKAVTDNTGKAELWSGFNKKDSSKYAIVINNQSTISSPLEFVKGMNVKQLNKSCNASNKVEIAFVVDATGSMGDEIEYLKRELEDVITKTFEKNSNLDLNIASVFYRDKGDEYLTKHIDFQTDLLKVANFIKLQRAAGGGDGPEAVNAALRTALDSLAWSNDARSKILFLVMDAPPHDEAATEMFGLLQKAAAKGIRIVPIACSGTDKSTEFIMRSIALATNGTYLFLTDHSGIGNAHIKPTTDAYNIELLNTMLGRTIEQMIFVHPCAEKTQVDEPYEMIENLNNITIYPNPTKGQLTIESNTPFKDIFVTDFTGKILIRINVKDKATRYRADISQYPSATYFIRYITEDDRWGTAKVILIH